MSSNPVQPQSLPQTSLYVGDLHPLVSESLLYATFSTVGHVLSARVCRDVALHTSLGYGYVNYENPKDAERALENLNYEDLLGRQIRIMWCQRDPSLRKSGRGNIFIKNLDKSIAQKDLYDTFCHFGKILSCKIAIDEAGVSKGYGFIHFHDEECAEAAIKAVNGKMINERIVFVGPFVPRSERKSANGKLKFNNCYVKNFSDELTDDELNKMFAEYGEIKSACIMRDSDGKSKGFGFVCYAEAESAEAAVNALNGKDLNGQLLYVNRAQRKSERQEVLRQRFEKHRAERLSKYAAGINLYVKNLDDTIDDARLKEAFGQFGKITSAKVMTDALGHSKGFGFVCFTTPDEAKDAVALNGTLLGSKPLYVALAQRREDRRAKLLAEHQQRMQYRANVASMPAAHAIPNFFPQPFSPTQRFFPTANLPSQPRWNRPGIGGPQVQFPQAGLGPNSLRPPIGPYGGNAGAMAVMGQGQMGSGSLVNSQFRGQAGARNVSSAIASGMAAGIGNSNMMAAGVGGPQQYAGQRTSLPPMMGPSGNPPRASMAAVTSGVRPASGSQMQRQMLAGNIPGATGNVRFHQTARNVAAPNQQPRQNVPMRQAVDGGVSQSVLSNLPERDQKQYLGEQIFRKVEKINKDLAGKITGMLIGMEIADLMRMIESDEFLREKVQEGIAVLEKRSGVNAASAATGATTTETTPGATQNGDTAEVAADHS